MIIQFTNTKTSRWLTLFQTYDLFHFLKITTLYIGAHPRLGALDVCPFIPIKGVTMDDCIKCAHQFSERLVKELDVPGKYTLRFDCLMHFTFT